MKAATRRYQLVYILGEINPGMDLAIYKKIILKGEYLKIELEIPIKVQHDVSLSSIENRDSMSKPVVVRTECSLLQFNKHNIAK